VDEVFKCVKSSNTKPYSSNFHVQKRSSSLIRQGAICLGAFKNDELLGYAWILLGTYEEDEVRCFFVPMPEGESAWDFDIYLDPKYRIGFAFPRLWDEVNTYLRSQNSE